MPKIKIAVKQYGGKSTLAKWIVSHFPEHRTYCEPFVGSCSVLFEKPRSFIEIINDMDGQIINVFKKIREEPEKLAAMLWATPYCNTNWRDFVDPETLEDARLFMAKSVQFYCGNGNTSTWAVDKSPCPHKPKQEVWADWFLRVLPAAARLRSCEILQEDAIKTILRVYQQEKTLIYVDPPYLGHEKEYKFGVNYQQMVAVLMDATSNVILSEYPEADKYFSKWRRVERECVGTCRTGAHNTKAKKKTEVLYMNF
jgi:DNA adenine methylase